MGAHEPRKPPPALLCVDSRRCPSALLRYIAPARIPICMRKIELVMKLPRERRIGLVRTQLMEVLFCLSRYVRDTYATPPPPRLDVLASRGESRAGSGGGQNGLISIILPFFFSPAGWSFDDSLFVAAAAVCLRGCRGLDTAALVRGTQKLLSCRSVRTYVGRSPNTHKPCVGTNSYGLRIL